MSLPTVVSPMINVLEVYDDDEIQAIHLSLFKDVGKRISIHRFDIFQYNNTKIQNPVDKVKTAN